MVEIQEAATAGEKWFDVAIVNEVYLCTDGAAPDPVGIDTVTIAGVRIAHECWWNCFENPTHGEGLSRVDKPFIAGLELIISRSHSARKCMAVLKSSVEQIRVFAVSMLPFL